jgi:hypothetical protein
MGPCPVIRRAAADIRGCHPMRRVLIALAPVSGSATPARADFAAAFGYRRYIYDPPTQLTSVYQWTGTGWELPCQF